MTLGGIDHSLLTQFCKTGPVSVRRICKQSCQHDQPSFVWSVRDEYDKWVWIESIHDQITLPICGTKSIRLFSFETVSYIPTSAIWAMIHWVKDKCRRLLDSLGRWSFNYFFYNKEIRKVLFIACTAKRYSQGNTSMVVPLRQTGHITSFREWVRKTRSMTK